MVMRNVSLVGEWNEDEGGDGGGDGYGGCLRNEIEISIAHVYSNNL